MSFEASAQANYDRPLSAKGEGKPLSRIPGAMLHKVLGFLCKILFRYEVVNRQVVQELASQGKGAVIVANHTSYIEVVMAFLAAWPATWIRFIGKFELFSKLGGFTGYLLSLIGAFPVSRDSADLTVVKRAVKDVKAGEFVQIYPEGTRRGRGNVQLRLHGGGTLIARMSKAPIIPSSCRNADRVKRKGERLRLPKLTYVYGDPVYLSDFDFLPKKDRLDACTWYVMRECYALFYGIEPEQVNMAQLFPDDRDFSAELAGVTLASRQERLPGKEA